LLHTTSTLAPPAATPAPRPAGPRPQHGGARPSVDGKFLAVGDERLWVRGVTYGTFAPDAAATSTAPRAIDADFAAMAAAGINAVRTYTVPTRELLDAAARHGLWVMAGCRGSSTSPSSTTTAARRRSSSASATACARAPATRRC
jgi:hypothetical protein